MTLLVSAPASSANLGSGFDCVALALDLWNELELEPGDGTVEIEGEGAEELPRDHSHLTVRAFAQFAPPDRYSFRFVNRIPCERGLGSSAAAIALGVAAGRAVSERADPPGELPAFAVQLEGGHADNVAAALAGGACLAWREGAGFRYVQLAEDVPFAPIAVIPGEHGKTSVSRSRLPFTIKHDDAVVAASKAALLAAGLASGDGGLLRASFDDVLHEPYRIAALPLLQALRAQLPAGAAGVTLSGSGPSVIVWAEPSEAKACAAALTARFPFERVLPLAVARAGAHTREVVA